MSSPRRAFSDSAHWLTFLAAAFALSLLAGCASRPIIKRIDTVDPHAGYRPFLLIPKRQNNDPHTLFALSFSVGGTRAAALSYGVLEQLRRTEIVVDGNKRRLLDEVDFITGVSGGSFTALSYALYGERLFAEYESRFLKRDVEYTLLSRALSPAYWPQYIGGSAGRSELAADYYDEILFEGATFADLLGKTDVPVAIASGTDLSTGASLGFYQNDFDLLCSDLNKVRLARTAATSSAVPMVLSPVTYDNYGGTCHYQYPPWIKAIDDPNTRARPSGRIVQRYKEMQKLQDSKDRPYIHLVDGGVSDNIGARGILEAIEELAVSAAFRDQVGFGAIRNFVIVIVNSRSSPSTKWDRVESPPGFVIQLLQSSSVPIDHYSFDTVETLQDMAEIWSWRRELLVAQARLAGDNEAQAEARFPKVTLAVLDVSFDGIADPTEREYFMNLPTSFVLSDEEVDRLREVGGRLLRQSEDYRALVRNFGGTISD